MTYALVRFIKEVQHIDTIIDIPTPQTSLFWYIYISVIKKKGKIRWHDVGLKNPGVAIWVCVIKKKDRLTFLFKVREISGICFTLIDSHNEPHLCLFDNWVRELDCGYLSQPICLLLRDKSFHEELLDETNSWQSSKKAFFWLWGIKFFKVGWI